MPRTEIFVSGEDVSVVTTATDERDFLDAFSEAMGALIGREESNGREARVALGAGYDIVAKLRGYKSPVQERRVLAAGRWPHPQEIPLVVATDEEAGGE